MPQPPSNNHSTPDDKHNRIFITGGASGLGKAIAVKYAREGYRVCIADLNDERGQETIDELTTMSCEAFYLHCDVTKIADLTTAKSQLVERWGGVDIVVNNAGVGGTAGPIEEVGLSDWDWVMNINLMGVVRGCKVFTPLFKQQGSGHFVNVASAAGLMNAPNMSSYNVSKAAVISLSETLKLELTKFNIHTSVVCPAFFKTNLTESFKSTVDGLTNRVAYVMAKSKVTADHVATDIFNAVEQKTFWVLSHKPERKLWRLKRYLPAVFDSVMKKQMAKLFK